MRNSAIKCVFAAGMVLFLFGGCGGPIADRGGPGELGQAGELGTTIASLAEIFPYGAVRLKGYALVGGLNGTGSSQCPAPIRAYLEKYILQELSSSRVDVERIIASNETAVVIVEGMMPAAAAKNEHFDVVVTSLAGTDTRSLEGGWLYGADLYEAQRLGMTLKPAALAEGAVFIDRLGSGGENKKRGYVLAGGTVQEEYRMNLMLREPDYKRSSDIRNRLNERFGYGTARAKSPGQIELTVPERYRNGKKRFFSVVGATYLSESPEIAERRVMHHIGKLASSQEKWASEIALEAMGSASLEKLSALVNSSNPEVRFRAARCMMNLGSERGFEVLREILQDKDSSYRAEALEAMTSAWNSRDVAGAARALVSDEDFDVRLAAYESLSKLDDITITREVVGENFYLDQVSQFSRPAVYVYRSGQPRVVLFRAPIYCRDDIFIQSSDGAITINAGAGQDYVSLMRKHPKRANVLAQLKSSFELADIIRTLCEEPTVHVGQTQFGLGVSYCELIELLAQMSEKGAIEAEFRAGSLPKIGVNIKN